MEQLERLADVHNITKAFFKKLDNIESVTHEDSMAILKEANSIAAMCNGAYGEYTYLFTACARHFDEMYQDFWDRIEKKGEYADEN